MFVSVCRIRLSLRNRCRRSWRALGYTWPASRACQRRSRSLNGWADRGLHAFNGDSAGSNPPPLRLSLLTGPLDERDAGRPRFDPRGDGTRGPGLLRLSLMERASLSVVVPDASEPEGVGGADGECPRRSERERDAATRGTHTTPYTNCNLCITIHVSPLPMTRCAYAGLFKQLRRRGFPSFSTHVIDGSVFAYRSIPVSTGAIALLHQLSSVSARSRWAAIQFCFLFITSPVLSCGEARPSPA